MDKVRIDKWLWAVRIFKTRTQATDACREGKISINESSAKAASLLTVNDVVTVKKGGFQFTYKALQLIEKRVGAPLAVLCFEDLTAPEELHKFEHWYSVKNLQGEFRPRGTGRPTKKERRDIDRLKTDD
ncbi:MAG: RNA-binding S4 domain-containing protein [Saprospiraceae bacterium]|nr:RNA-binding S4 domain-containing protein [Saprospiraceae bacterium]MCB9319225.1 RNA-binding S4 domain-containing protein [Lewinellaceae bacterium]